MLLKRNCSISPAGLWGVFAVIALVTLGIGTGFAYFGAWLILPFAGLELLVLGIAFVAAGRHATDCERIEFAGRRVRVEVREAEQCAVHEFDPARARVEIREERGTVRVWLRASEARLEVGRHLDEQSRAGFGAELERRLRSTLFGVSGEGKT